MRLLFGDNDRPGFFIQRRDFLHDIAGAALVPLAISWVRQLLKRQLLGHGPLEPLVIVPVERLAAIPHDRVEHERREDQHAADGEDEGHAQHGKGEVAHRAADLLTATGFRGARDEGQVVVRVKGSGGEVDDLLLQLRHRDGEPIGNLHGPLIVG